LSTASNASVEGVAAASKGDLWFQLYIVQRKLAKQMVRRADAASYSTLVLTTDVGFPQKVPLFRHLTRISNF
jgi:(S)-mandelate dehydrogenase